MRYLYYTLWCLGLIIALSLMELLLDNIFPDVAVFTHNLISLAQLLILLWVILTLAHTTIKSKKAAYIKMLIMALAVVVPELTINYLLNHPKNIPAFCKPAFKYYYAQAATNIIQFNADCSVYDSNLFYTLKPSAAFSFGNYEFRNSYNTNSLGLRDDEDALIKPEIICLGDSYAMGWGVDQQETFAKILSRQTGKKILNAAMSSYGTARELTSFNRLDTSNLKYIIIQYCRNDFTENKTCADAEYTLKTSSENIYNSAVEVQYWNTRWFPGKHTISFTKLNTSRTLPAVFNMVRKPTVDSPALNLQLAAFYFTDILARSSINFQKLKVFVVDLNEKRAMNNDFINAVNSLMNTPSFKNRFNNNLVMVPVADLLTTEDYYILDPHLRPSGHQKIAERLKLLID